MSGNAVTHGRDYEGHHAGIPAQSSFRFAGLPSGRSESLP
jgi:hypothetical protein